MSDILINHVSPIQQLKDLQAKTSRSADSNAGDFQKLLGEALIEVDQLQKSSDAEIDRLMSGKVEDVHGAMVALQKADLSFQMMMQVRNKLVEAYHEMMRMQV